MVDIPEPLLRTFRDEAEEVLAELERCTLELDGGGDDLPLLEAMFRCAHTLKGNASCLGFDGMTRLAHKLEEAISSAIGGKKGADPALIRLVLESLDDLARMAAADPGTVVIPVDAGAAQKLSRAIRVDVARLDRALDLVGELGRCPADALDEMIKQLQARILELRLVAVRASFERFRRAVRDIASAAGKEVRLELRCEDVEVDVSVVDALRGPLGHLLRNAIDHGIEPAAARRAAGKPPIGTVTLSARHEGAHLIVELADDGAGMSRERLIERGRALGLDVAGLDDEHVWDLAFAPGLSTAAKVTDLSGRGIGMDVVRRTIESLRGSVTLASVPGAGVTVAIRLPLTLSIVQGLAVGIDDDTYILPLDHVVECVDLEADRVIESVQGGVLELRGEALPYLSLARAVGARADGEGHTSVVVVEQGGRRAGLAVDRLHGEVQTVIKPLGSLFDRVRGLTGSALLADGRVALVVDVRGLLRAATV
jgi:two-component system, chemotaxis family, sensor kinase CheA